MFAYLETVLLPFFACRSESELSRAVSLANFAGENLGRKATKLYLEFLYNFNRILQDLSCVVTKHRNPRDRLQDVRLKILYHH